jgi:hypothetical protein
MRTHSPHVAIERHISPKEFERLLRRAERWQKLRRPQSMLRISRERKRPASAA